MLMRFFALSIIPIALLLTTAIVLGDDQSSLQVEQMFSTDMANFGFALKGDVFCDPFWGDADRERAPAQLRRMGETAYRNNQADRSAPHDTFLPIPDENLPQPLRSLLGDTLKAVWHEGIHDFTIDAYGYYSDPCHSQVACALEPVDRLSHTPNWNETFLLLRPDVRVSDFRQYDDYFAGDESLWAHEDSIKTAIRKMQREQTTPPLDTFLVEYYGVRGPRLPDTLFMTVHGADGSTESCWHTVQLLTKEGKVWKRTEVIALRRGSFSFRMACSFDMNGDGTTEYLVSGHASGAVYSFIDGRLVLVAAGPYRGC